MNFITRLIPAVRYACQGLKAAFKHEAAFRLEVMLSIILIPAAFHLGETTTQQTLLLASWVLVIVVELLNSAIENTIDRISPEKHELAGRAKDQSSAAVLISVILFITIWANLIFDRIG